MHHSPSIQSAIKQSLSNHFPIEGEMKFQPVGGGSINDTFRIVLNNQSIFCKQNSASKFPQLFTKEKNGLTILKETNVIKLPSVIDCIETDDKQLLLMECITPGDCKENFWERFGEKLALLHQHTAKHFGLQENNYMGSVPQSNLQHRSWTSFFTTERLQPMVARCYNKLLITTEHLQQFETLYKKLDEVFEPEPPSLLHGDLWSGNFMCNQNSEPVLIDPAVYYGHRSVDLAMTTLFGGFRQPFYEAYHHHFPFPSNYKEQWDVCNLYPLLIHLYLFGSSYRSQIETTLRKFQ